VIDGALVEVDHGDLLRGAELADRLCMRAGAVAPGAVGGIARRRRHQHRHRAAPACRVDVALQPLLEVGRRIEIVRDGLPVDGVGRRLVPVVRAELDEQVVVLLELLEQVVEAALVDEAA
jgi:hypothetical protein